MAAAYGGTLPASVVALERDRTQWVAKSLAVRFMQELWFSSIGVDESDNTILLYVESDEAPIEVPQIYEGARLLVRSASGWRRY